MQNVKRIFIVADFKDESARSFQIQSRMWIKGLLRLGHDVQRFSYRNIIMQCSRFPGKRIAQHLARKKADAILLEQIRGYQPEILLILSMKYLNHETVSAMRDVVPNAVFVSRDDDPFPDRNPARIAVAQRTDLVITTSGGRFLQVYKDAGVPCCAFIPNMCDPDIQYRYNVGEKWKTDIIFTGKPEHTKLERNNERFTLTQRLSRYPNTKIYGFWGIPRIEGLDYFYAISGAKIGMSINITNDVELYHSDRLINYIACGTFTLAKRVPKSELLFEDKKHLVYFDKAEEFFELADWYLKHNDESEKIASIGMEHAHKEFNCTRIAGLFMDLIEKGNYDAPWAVVL